MQKSFTFKFGTDESLCILPEFLNEVSVETPSTGSPVATFLERGGATATNVEYMAEKLPQGGDKS